MTKTLIEAPPARIGFSVAENRRRAIERHLNEHARQGLRLRAFRSSYMTPLRDEDQSPYLKGAAAAAEIVRLRWQIQSYGFLLLEGVIDALDQFLRSRRKLSLEPGSVSVSLQPITRRSLSGRRLPWRVVIHAPDYVDMEDMPFGDPDVIGIGVDVGSASDYRFLGGCTDGYGGMDGVVGGVLRIDDNVVCGPDFLLTCRHVLSSECRSLRYPTSNNAEDAPDAALLYPTDCFSYPYPDRDAIRVYPATVGDIDQIQLSQSSLVLNRSDGNRTRGWLKYPVGAVIGPTGKLIRFPHYSIQTFRYRIGFLRWPVIRTSFAHPGDSGTSVIERNTGLWVGMVTQGYGHDSDTLVVDARSLLDYFDCLVHETPNPDGEIRFGAYTWPFDS